MAKQNQPNHLTDDPLAIKKLPACIILAHVFGLEIGTAGAKLKEKPQSSFFFFLLMETEFN